MPGNDELDVDDFEIPPELCALIHKILTPDEAQQKSDALFNLGVQKPDDPEFYIDILPDLKEEIRPEIEKALREDTVMDLITKMEIFFGLQFNPEVLLFLKPNIRFCSAMHKIALRINNPPSPGDAIVKIKEINSNGKNLIKSIQRFKAKGWPVIAFHDYRYRKIVEFDEYQRINDLKNSIIANVSELIIELQRIESAIDENFDFIKHRALNNAKKEQRLNPVRYELFMTIALIYIFGTGEEKPTVIHNPKAPRDSDADPSELYNNSEKIDGNEKYGGPFPDFVDAFFPGIWTKKQLFTLCTVKKSGERDGFEEDI